MRVRRTAAQLADGRDILYFDDRLAALADGGEPPGRRLTDPRDLPRTSTRSEIRFDAVLGEWVGIASHRQDRTHLPSADDCPLCPSREGRQSEIPSSDYDVVVFENRFPSFAMQIGPLDPLGGVPVPPEQADDLFQRRPGVGRCEVVCFTSDHDGSFAQLDPGRVGTVIEAWVDRTEALSRLPHVEQVYCFENRGREIGVTLPHPHGQIYAYPFVTPRTRTALDAARRYRERTWRNLFADLLAAERAAEVRVVTRSAHWTAFVPFAARWPVEVHLYPNRQVPGLADLTDDERGDLATAYLDVLRRLDAVYGVPMPYVAAWHQAPVRVDRDLAYLHLELFSIRRAPEKLKYLAGSESGMGAFVNDGAPERVAARLREAAP